MLILGKISQMMKSLNALIIGIFVCMCLLFRSSFAIIGGTLTTIDQVPYLVRIHYDQQSMQYIGVGTLIAPRYVVTSAYILTNRQTFFILVVGGATGRLQQGVRRRVSKASIPNDYDGRSYYNDVAVLQLVTGMFALDTVPIPLCNSKWVARDNFRVSGWGTTAKRDNTFPTNIHTVVMQTSSLAECQAAHANNQSKTIICGLILAGKNFCRGDSGAGAIRNGQLCGVASTEESCFDGTPRFTNIMVVKSFIQEAIKG